MKYYLTKEWFYDIIYPLTLGRGIKVCEEAGRAEEELYRRFYQKELESFMIKEKARLSPLDANDLPWLDRTLSRSGLTKENRQALKSLLWKEIEEKKKEGFEIDEEAIRRKFDNYLDNKLKICEQLPQEILREIADIRVFCLGYMTQKVKNMLSTYLEEKDKENLRLVELSLSGSGKSGGGFAKRNPLYQLCRADVIGDRESGEPCGNTVYRSADVDREERERHRMGGDCA